MSEETMDGVSVRSLNRFVMRALGIDPDMPNVERITLEVDWDHIPRVTITQVITKPEDVCEFGELEAVGLNPGDRVITKCSLRPKSWADHSSSKYRQHFPDPDAEPITLAGPQS